VTHVCYINTHKLPSHTCLLYSLVACFNQNWIYLTCGSHNSLLAAAAAADDDDDDDDDDELTETPQDLKVEYDHEDYKRLIAPIHYSHNFLSFFTANVVVEIKKHT